jgi:hypothetical protein
MSGFEGEMNVKLHSMQSAVER